MSIATKKGDRGETGLMYNRRVSKFDPRVEAGGAVDELNAALGHARATGNARFITENLVLIQKDLVVLMGELATLPEDRERYLRDGFVPITEEEIRKLDGLVSKMESESVSFKGWATPGATIHASALDLARTACRRAERRACALQAAGELPNAEILIYLNRLSDVLWLMARWVETQELTQPGLTCSL